MHENAFNALGKNVMPYLRSM